MTNARHASLVECFRGDQLRTYSVGEVGAVGLSARSVDLLTTVGLPRRRWPYFMATDLVPFGMGGSRPAAVHRGSLVRVGVCDQASFAVDVISDALWFVAPESPSGRRARVPVRFVNSHLDAYLECLCRARPMLDGQPDEPTGHDRRGVFERLGRELESVDGNAFADPDSYWSVIFWNLTAFPTPPDLADDGSLIACFGRDNLRAYAAAEVEAARLRARIAPLLITLGLPRRWGPYFAATDLASLTLHGSALHALHPEGFVRIGRYGETDIALDRTTGAVWQLGDFPEPCFVNTDLRAYLGCLCHVWRTLDEGAAGLPIPAERGLVARLHEEVRMMDERALAHGETYWSVVLEELGNALS